MTATDCNAVVLGRPVESAADGDIDENAHQFTCGNWWARMRSAPEADALSS